VATLFVQGLLEWIADNASTSISKIVLVDVNQPAVTAICDALHAASSTPASQPPIASAPVKSIKQFQWSWKDDYGWVKYDPDQNTQIERAFYEHQKNSSVTKVQICGDKDGVMSISKHKPAGAPAAVYEVDFLSMKQINIASGFKRGVKRENAPQLADIVLSVGSPATPKQQAPSARVVINSLPTGGGAAATKPSHDAAADGGTHAQPPATRRASKSAAGIMCYALSDANARAAVQGMQEWIKDKWVISDSFPAGSVVPFAAMVAAVKRVAAKNKCQIVEDNDADRTFKVKALGTRSFEAGKSAVIQAVLQTVMNFKDDRDKPPSTWDSNQPNNLGVYDVAQGSAEWQDAEARFNTHGFSATIVKLERIQNKYVWGQYVQQRTAIADLLGGDPNEVLDLKHGTGSTDPSQVYGSDVGIDYRYSDWGMYGKGAYFAEDPDYTHSRGYTFDTGDGNNSMFLCRVLAGKVDQRTADSQIKHPAVGHQSVRGIVHGNQFAYILYEHYRSYPDYLVTYKK